MIHACLVAFCSAVSLQDQGQVAGEYTLFVSCKPGGRHALRYVPCGRQPATTAHPPQCIAPGTWCPGSKPYWKCPNEVSCPSACAGLAGPGMCTGLLQIGYSCGPTPPPCSARPAVSRMDTVAVIEAMAVAGLLRRVRRVYEDVPQAGAADTLSLVTQQCHLHSTSWLQSSVARRAATPSGMSATTRRHLTAYRCPVTPAARPVSV